MLRDLTIRALALLATILVIAYPVRAFLTLPSLPLPLRLTWLLVFAAAAMAPRLSLLVFLAAAPLLPMTPGRHHWPTVSLPELWLFALLIPAWLRLVGRPRSANSPLPAAATLLLAVATASLFVTLYPFHLAYRDLGSFLQNLADFGRSDFIVAVSQRHLYAAIVSWAILAEGLALLWLVVTDLQAHGVGAALWAARAAGAGCAAVAVQAIVQRITRADLLLFWVEQNPYLVRVNASFTDVNGLGAYLALMLGVLVALGRIDRSAWRWFWRAAAGAAVLALVFTASRIAWVAALAAAALYAMGLWRFDLLRPGAWAARHARRLAITAALGGIAVGGGLVAYATVSDVRNDDQRSYLQTVMYSVNLKVPSDERFKGRLAFWDAAVRMIAARPVFGIGVGRYYKQVWAFARHQEALPLPQENAHNYFLQTGAELGMVGLAALATLWLAAVAAAIRAAASRALPPAARVLALGTGVGIVAYGVASTTGHPLLVREGQYAFWPIVAVALGLAQAAGNARPVRPGLRRLLAALTVAVLLTVPLRARREAEQVDLSRYPSGLGDQETIGNMRFRWSGDQVVFHVPSNARVFVLPIRSLAPVTQQIAVRLDGELADHLMMADHDWHTLRYVLPRKRHNSRYLRLTLDVTPTWRAPNDPRTLGVMVGDYRWAF